MERITTKQGYTTPIYKIEGEKIEPQPQEIFVSANVYLIIDQPIKIIWIWAGKKSRLFHRYIAASWAGKLKSRKFHGFKYEIIKEDQEPSAFLHLFRKIKGESTHEEADFQISGDKLDLLSTNLAELTPRKTSSTHPPREHSISSAKTNITIKKQSYQNLIPGSRPPAYAPMPEKTQILNIFSEIKEIHSQVIYSLQHVEQRIHQIEEIFARIEAKYNLKR